MDVSGYINVLTVLSLLKESLRCPLHRRLGPLKVGTERVKCPACHNSDLLICPEAELPPALGTLRHRISKSLINAEHAFKAWFPRSYFVTIHSRVEPIGCMPDWVSPLDMEIISPPLLCHVASTTTEIKDKGDVSANRNKKQLIFLLLWGVGLWYCASL